MKRVLATVFKNTEIMPKTCLIQVEAPNIANEVQPGQYLMVRCGQDYNFSLRRPLSIHHIDIKQGQIWLLLAVKGRGTSWLAKLKEGDTLDLIGPLGQGFIIRPETYNLLLVAGGMGIAPLLFLAEQALSRKKAVTLLLGASNTSQLYPRNFLPSCIECLIATDDGSAGKKARVTDLIPGFLDWTDQIYACGPVAMYQTIAKQQQQLHPKRLSIQVSLEIRLGCGIGACYGCTINTKQGLKKVCHDGPVFELEDILWQEIRL